MVAKPSSSMDPDMKESNTASGAEVPYRDIVPISLGRRNRSTSPSTLYSGRHIQGVVQAPRSQLPGASEGQLFYPDGRGGWLRRGHGTGSFAAGFARVPCWVPRSGRSPSSFAVKQLMSFTDVTEETGRTCSCSNIP